MERKIKEEEVKMLQQRMKFRVAYEKLKDKSETLEFYGSSRNIRTYLKKRYNEITTQLNLRGYKLKYLK